MYSTIFPFLILAMAMASLSYAQDHVVTLALAAEAGGDPSVNQYGSILGSDATATTYVISQDVPCPSYTTPTACEYASFLGSDATSSTYSDETIPCPSIFPTTTNCQGGPPMTLTEGASFAAWTSTAEYHHTNGSLALAWTAYQSCSLDGTVSAVCHEFYGGYEANFPGSSVETYTGTDIGYGAVTITAGVAVNSAASSTGPPSSTSGAVAVNTAVSSISSAAATTISSSNAGESSTKMGTSEIVRETGTASESSMGPKPSTSTSGSTAVKTGGTPVFTNLVKLLIWIRWALGTAAAAIVIG